MKIGLESMGTKTGEHPTGSGERHECASDRRAKHEHGALDLPHLCAFSRSHLRTMASALLFPPLPTTLNFLPLNLLYEAKKYSISASVFLSRSSLSINVGVCFAMAIPISRSFRIFLPPFSVCSA